MTAEKQHIAVTPRMRCVSRNGKDFRVFEIERSHTSHEVCD